MSHDLPSRKKGKELSMLELAEYFRKRNEKIFGCRDADDRAVNYRHERLNIPQERARARSAEDWSTACRRNGYDQSQRRHADHSLPQSSTKSDESDIKSFVSKTVQTDITAFIRGTDGTRVVFPVESTENVQKRSKKKKKQRDQNGHSESERRTPHEVQERA